jgi:hypothetical protein
MIPHELARLKTLNHDLQTFCTHVLTETNMWSDDCEQMEYIKSLSNAIERRIGDMQALALKPIAPSQPVAHDINQLKATLKQLEARYYYGSQYGRHSRECLHTAMMRLEQGIAELEDVEEIKI